MNNNNISNSRSTNINSESHITQSHNYNNAFKTISNLKLNLLNNDNDQMISQMNLNILNSQRPKINSVDDKENFKNFSNSFVDPTPKNKIDYSCNKIDFNYNTNTKTSPRYQNSNNHSAFINSDINTYKKNCMNKSSLSPNSQKKINYFNTDICDISINKKPIHNVERDDDNSNEISHKAQIKSSIKLRYNTISNENEDYLKENKKYRLENLSKKNNEKDNKLKKYNNKNLNNGDINNMSDINNRSKIEIPNTLSCFDDFSPKNVNFRSTRNLDSEYANDEKLKFQETNFTAFNNKYENDDSKNSGSLNIMNNTVIGNYQNKRGNDKNIYDKSFCKNINNNVSHYSYISEKNNKDYKLKLRNIDFQNYMNKNQVNNIYENNSPQSRNALNIKNLNRVNGVNFNISDNKNYLFSNVNNNYIDSLYYGGDANTTNKTQISTISSKFIFLIFLFS